MAVSIPQKLQRFNSSPASPKNDRINLNIQDSSAQIMNTVNNISSLGNAAMDVYQKVENEKIDQVATQTQLAYQTWNEEKLSKLKSFEGDPTEAYAAYEKEAKEKYDEILGAFPDTSERVKRHVQGRFEGFVQKQNIAAYKQRGAQQETYDNKIYEVDLKRRRESLPVIGGYVNPEDPSSTLLFEQEMADIKTAIAKRGMRKGSVQVLDKDATKYSHMFKDDDGNIVKVQMNDFAKARAAKELSEGVKSTIDAMIAAGNVKEAKFMREKYADLIDSKGETAIDNKIKKEGRKAEAYDIINTGKSIDSIQDEELKDEVLKIKSARDNRIASLRKNSAKKNYDYLASHVLEKMQSEDPYHGVADLENDPVYKKVWDNLDVKGKKAVIAMVEAPKESNPKSLARVNNLLLGDDPDFEVETMSVQDFQEYLSGLSKGERAKAQTRFNSIRKKGSPENSSVRKLAGDYLKKQMLMAEVISKNAYGRIEDDDEIELFKAQEDLLAHMEKSGGSYNASQIQSYVKEYVGSVIKGKVFNPPSRGGTVSRSTSNKKNIDIQGLEKSTVRSLMKKFYDLNKRHARKDSDEFQLFVNKNIGSV